MTRLDALLRRERAVVAAALALLVLLAWIYLWRGAGTGMSALDMTKLTLFPHAQAEPMSGMTPPPYLWSVALAMWWVMMIAMMMPSAAPLILLYGRVLRHSADKKQIGATYTLPLLLAAGYLIAWLAFSMVATILQYALQRAALMSSMMLWSKNAWLSAAVLIGAGVYQLSPLKQSCLKHCRSPMQFLTRRWQPGLRGALVMGLEHGAWCVGCCWLLMLLLFIGGVMNLVWIALLALLVLVEKLAPNGAVASRMSGAVLIVWGVITLAV